MTLHSNMHWDLKPGRYDPPSGQLLQQESLPLGSSRLAEDHDVRCEITKDWWDGMIIGLNLFQSIYPLAI
jgi:hypothetical protein